MRTLIIGGSGFLGKQIARRAIADGDRVTVTFRTNPASVDGVDEHRLDLRDERRTRSLIDRLEPELIINTAFHPRDWSSTAVAPAILARVVAGKPVRLVQVSSDAIFSGNDSCYDETALPDPITPYGAAKAAAETAVAAICPTAVIARTSLIIGHGESSSERLAHELATGHQDGALFTDDVRCPVHVDDLAAALLELGRGNRSGIHHVAGPEAISRYRLGILIARRDGLPTTRIRTGSRTESGIPGPIDVRLDSTNTRRQLRTRLRGVSDFLATAYHPEAQIESGEDCHQSSIDPGSINQR